MLNIFKMAVAGSEATFVNLLFPYVRGRGRGCLQ